MNRHGLAHIGKFHADNTATVSASRVAALLAAAGTVPTRESTHQRPIRDVVYHATLQMDQWSR